MGTEGELPSVALLDDPDRVVEVLTPFRRRLLALLDRPDSATGVAGRIGASRQLVNYHLRALEEAGLVELVAERPRRGATERLLRRRADAVWVDPASFVPDDLHDRDRVGVVGVLVTAADLVRHAARVAADSTRARQRVAGATLDVEVRLADPQALRTLVEDLAAVVAAYDSPGAGLRMRVATMALPGIVEDEQRS